MLELWMAEGMRGRAVVLKNKVYVWKKLSVPKSVRKPFMIYREFLQHEVSLVPNVFALWHRPV